MADETNPIQTTEQAPAQTPEGAENSGGSGLTFDQWLDSNPAYRSEFDRRNTKAVQTARTRWEQEQAETQDEATKLARMTAAQREKYQLDKDRQTLEQERAAFQRQQLEVQTGAQLQGMGYDAGFAKYLTGRDAEATSANLTAFDGLMRAYRASAVNDQMRGGTPPKDTTPSAITRESLNGMSRAEISKAFEEGRLDGLLGKK
ncbi:MAG: DUF4355 domain-containing protein [Clostridiales bacterium]|nr:DUF4355 domain-containing protein [Clostridiales bacterium]